MSFFASVKENQFAAKLFASVGFKFEDAFKANNENALKAFVDGAVAAKAGDSAENEKILAAAAKENETLSTALANANLVATAQGETCATMLAGFGIQAADVLDDKKVFSADKFKAAHKLAIAKAARIELAKHGITPLEDKPEEDPTKKGKKSSEQKVLTFVEFNALEQKDRIIFSRNGGKITG